MIGYHLDNVRQALYKHTSILLSDRHIISTMNSLSEDFIQLVDLPDELILIIMNKVKPKVLLLCSIITIGNNRLEKLALDMCHSIDLTFDYFQSPNQFIIPRFYTHVMPCIINNIQSLTLSIQHIPNMITFVERYCNGTLPNLTYLKIIIGRQNSMTGTPYTLDIPKTRLESSVFQVEVNKKLVPKNGWIPMSNAARTLSKFLCSLSVPSIVSFELEDDCILTNIFNDDDLFFPESIHLTHIRITLFKFEHCICLLNQLGSQLCSFVVNVMFVSASDAGIFSKIKSISCPNLKRLTMISFRSIIDYENLFLPVLQRLSNVEYLILLLAIEFKRNTPKHFIDGFDLDKDIISYMPHLCQFHFHIRSILPNASHVEIDTIRQTFMKQQQPVDCAIDYFNNNHGQCQIYSLPFIGTRLDFVSNRFPLFDTNKTFSMVTKLLLFDDIQPFESAFFERVSRTLPHLKTLDIMNELEQQEKIETTTNNLEFTHLTTLILFDIHLDYAEQLLCRSHLPSLIELAIDSNILLKIIAQDQQQAKGNCSRIGTLLTSHPFYHSIDTLRNFFPRDSYVPHPKE
ncbi:unnamed protein product [Rotaria socialis]|uniref:F-box domain-containing protein n=2 Tax=Rotaria socialis TaxID=392032 RepID=A0A820SB63_9BILA|nr:unnamed protein product [Rotaria socialis]CAF4453444.1 unnamed protein product [Rotaria socialis]CAF4484628.1 unnamed protein product [Rotaria socialis]